ncbi:MAG: hypothetical protein WAU59_17515 [Rhodoplanes sp.]
MTRTNIVGTLAVPRKHHENRDSVKTKRAEHLDRLAPQNRPRAQKPSICSVFQHYQTSKPSKLGQAGLDTPSARLALAQRIALAALAIFLMLNAVTPFITPAPPWLVNLPLVVAIMVFLLAFGLSHIRAERGRQRPSNGPRMRDPGWVNRQPVPAKTVPKLCSPHPPLEGVLVLVAGASAAVYSVRGSAPQAPCVSSA